MDNRAAIRTDNQGSLLGILNLSPEPGLLAAFYAGERAEKGRIIRFRVARRRPSRPVLFTGQVKSGPGDPPPLSSDMDITFF